MPPRTAYSPASRTVEDTEEAVAFQPGDDVVHVDAVAAARAERAASTSLARRNALQCGVDRAMTTPAVAGLPSRASRDSVAIRRATMAGCGETRS